MDQKVRILAFGGSLRMGSYNKTLLHTSIILEESYNVCPDIGEIEIYDNIGDFPLFSQDLEAKMPKEVMNFKARLKSADAVLIATPEYDYSVPGYLKNAIDWASRPYGDNSFDDKPGALLSASPGPLGGVKAQYALRQVSVSLNLHLINRPEVMIANIHEKIENNRIADETVSEKIKELLAALCDWSLRLQHQ